MSTVTQEIQDQVSSLYIAFFGRAPDAEGFGYWAQEIAGGMSPFKIAGDFALSNEWTSNYGGLTPTQQVERFYQNVFGRAADAEGLAYWVAEIDGGLPFSSVAYQIIWAAYLGGDTVDPADNALVLNKIAVAEYFAIDLASNDTTLAATAFNGVTQDVATVTAAESRLSAAVNAGETFTLTTGIDSGAAFTGTAYDDTYNAAFFMTNAGVELQTLNPLDSLNGAGGINTLNAQINTTVTPLSLANIQVVNSTMTVGSTLGLANAGQLTTLNDVGSNVNSTYTGLAATAVNLGVKDASTTGLTTSFQYTTTTGTQSVNLAVENLSDVAADRIIQIDGVETINVTAAGAASFYQLDADAATSLTFAGSTSQTLATTAGTVNVSSFNGSAATGALNLTVGNQTGIGAADVTVVGGTGNDTLTLTAQVTNQNSVNGGAGNDTFVFGANLIANTATAANNYTVIGGDGFDTISAESGTLATINNSVAGAVQSISGVESLTVSNGLADDLVLSRIQSGIQQLSTSGTAAARSVTFDSGVSGTIRLTGTGFLGGDLTVVSAGAATSDSISIVNATVGTDVFDGRNLTATGVETLSINGGTTTTRINQDIGTIGSTSGTTSVNFSGNNNINVGAITAGSINASGLTGTAALVQVAASVGVTSITGSGNSDELIGSATATTIDGGAGNDNITGGVAADSIVGGAGNDTIAGAGGNDTLLGGDGADTISAIVAGVVNIDGGAGNDTIDIGSTLSTGDVVNGGDGVDTLAMSTALISDFAGVTNIETLRLDAAMTQNLARFTGTTLDRVNVNVAGAVVVTNASSAVTALGSITGSTATLSRATNTAADAITVSGITAAGGIAFTALTLNNEDTVTFAQGGMNAGTLLTVTALNAIDVDSIVITGNQNSSITVGATGAEAGFGNTGAAVITRTITVDASDAVGTVVFNGATALGTQTLVITGSDTAASTLTGGAGNDTITMGNSATGNIANGGAGNDVITGGTGADALNGDAGADSISGGAGADTITGGTGADQMTGGTGIDTFVFGIADSVAATANSLTAGGIASGNTITFGNNVDVITDFAATDRIDVVNAAAPTTLLGVTTAAVLVAGDSYVAYGTYDSLVGSFTIAAAFNATTAKDALLIADGNGLTAVTSTSYVVIEDLTAALAAANFV